MTLTVGELIEALKGEDPATPVILQKDSEGNGFSPLAGSDPALYAAETDWMGEVYDLPGEDGPDPDDEDAAPDDAVRCLVLYPTN